MKASLRAPCLALLTLSLAALPGVEAGEVLNGVKARDQLRCGVSEDIPGFSEQDAEGLWRGLDVDFCRAVAAAVLGDPDKVEFIALRTSARFPSLQTRRVDLLLGSTTWTLTREAVLKVQFPGILFYDGQGFMVPAGAKIDTLAALNGAKVCVERGTTNEQTLDAYFKAQGWSVEPVVADSAPKAAEALFAGRCAAYTSDAAQLAAMRQRAPGGPDAFAILPERISREPLSPAVWGGDPEWTTVVRWVLNVLILAEYYGATRANPDADAVAAERVNPWPRSAEDREHIAQAMGIPTGWARRLLQAVGNYGEVYERNVGRDSPLKIERGLNRLWIEGGLHYAPPID
jgi:general L-amino acid transport system substrate-binding protein